jgi:putative SOS response-associated peptidase YedK
VPWRLGELHDRMSVIRDEADWAKWLGEDPATQDQLYALLTSCPDEAMKIWWTIWSVTRGTKGLS